MKLLIFYVIFVIACGYVQAKSTLFDTMKDDFDTVFKYEFEKTEHLLKHKKFEEYKYDIHFRKMTDEHTFLMYFSNVRYEASDDMNNKPTAEDLKAMELPIVVTIDSDLDVQYIMASKEDTSKSLDEKSDLFHLILVDLSDTTELFPKMLANINFTTFKKEAQKIQLGTCDINVKLSKKSTTYRFKVGSERHECTGSLEPGILNDTNIEEVDGSSEFSISYYYDKETLNFQGVNIKMFLKDAEHPKHTFKVESEAYFTKYEPIHEHFSEFLFTKKYTREELAELD